MSGVGEKLVTKTWMPEIFRKSHILSAGDARNISKESHILSAGGDALIKWKCSVGP